MALVCDEKRVSKFFRLGGSRYRSIRRSGGSRVKIPEHIAERWFLDRLIFEKVVTYEELRRFLSLDDVIRWNEILDARDDEQWLQSKEIEQKMKR